MRQPHFFSMLRIVSIHFSAFDIIAEATSMIMNARILFILRLICYKYRLFSQKNALPKGLLKFVVSA